MRKRDRGRRAVRRIARSRPRSGSSTAAAARRTSSAVAAAPSGRARTDAGSPFAAPYARIVRGCEPSGEDMEGKAKTGISPTRAEDFPQWFQSVVRDAEVAELDHVRGAMVIRPWGFGTWELMQRSLDAAIKATGARNAYFPLFIPLSYFEEEAKHVEGFAKEMAVVTHHR